MKIGKIIIIPLIFLLQSCLLTDEGNNTEEEKTVINIDGEILVIFADDIVVNNALVKVIFEEKLYEGKTNSYGICKMQLPYATLFSNIDELVPSVIVTAYYNDLFGSEKAYVGYHVDHISNNIYHGDFMVTIKIK